MRRRIATAIWVDRRFPLGALLLAIATTGIVTPPAQASLGYALDATNPSRSLGSNKIPHGIAVDQASRRVYVAILTTNAGVGAPGEIDRFESDLTDAGAVAAGGGYYSGVAVNPLTQGIYAAQTPIHSPIGLLGQSRMDLFSSAGAAGTQFALDNTEAFPQVAADSNGHVYFPNAATHSVQVFNSAGALQEEIDCAGCTGGSFGTPVSVALNSNDDLYVVDLSPDRVVKLTSSGGPYSFSSVLQSGRGAAAVAVDPSGDDVLVGDLPNGKSYHIVAYSSSGEPFDDFGAGLFTDPQPSFGAKIAVQIAADATTHRLYVGEVGKFYIFDKVPIVAPTVTIEPPSPVGQLTATLRSTVNANGHAVLECDFEFTDDADFQANGFANATPLACPLPPDGSSDTALRVVVPGLTPDSTYHYRVTVASYAGPVTSGGETFETLPSVPPAVTMEPPLSLKETSATLRGKVNPLGGSVSDCHFEFGTSSSYGTNLPCSSLPGPVATDVAESRKVSALTPGATYHYRLVVSSNAGTTAGEDVAFTTSTPPPLAESGPGNSPPTTTPPPSPPPPHPLRCRKGFQKKRIRGKPRCVKKKRHRGHKKPQSR